MDTEATEDVQQAIGTEIIASTSAAPQSTTAEPAETIPEDLEQEMEEVE